MGTTLHSLSKSRRRRRSSAHAMVAKKTTTKLDTWMKPAAQHGFTGKWENLVAQRHVSRNTFGGQWLSVLLASAAVLAAGALIARGVRRATREVVAGPGLIPTRAEDEAAEEQQFLLGLE